MAESQRTLNPSPPPPNMPAPTARKWGELPTGTWVTTHALVGRRFIPTRVTEAVVNDKPSYVIGFRFAPTTGDKADSGAKVPIVVYGAPDASGKPAKTETEVDPTGDFQFSAERGARGTIGKQIAREPLPLNDPTHVFTVTKTATTANPSGYYLALAEV